MFKNKFLEFVSKVPEELVNPTRERLYDLASHQMIKNEFGNPLFHSKITARSAAFTHILGENDSENEAVINQVFDLVKPEDFVVMHVYVGENPAVRMKATMAVYKKNANIALMMERNFFVAEEPHENPDIITLYVPHFPERRVIVDPKRRMTYVLGIDYYGEAKMSILRMAMEIMRTDKGGLGVHAGSKVYKLNIDNELKELGMIIFGLSGTGKTTLTCHDHGLQDPEGVLILQDDICLIDAESNVYGTEKGFYVKCDSFPEHEQLTSATIKPGNIMENVYVDEDGKVDWKNFSVSQNTRALISRQSLRGTGDTIDLPNLDFILYNTRRPEMPPIGRLISADQSAAYYALGESIVTSAEDPTRVGEPRRVVGFDPFIISEKGKNVNRMAEVVRRKPEAQSFLVNTGFVGDESNDIGVKDSIFFIEAALRGEIEWEFDEDLGYEIPKTVKGKDFKAEFAKFDPRAFFGEEEYKKRMDALREDRKEFLRAIGGVSEEIINSV